MPRSYIVGLIRAAGVELGPHDGSGRYAYRSEPSFDRLRIGGESACASGPASTWSRPDLPEDDGSERAFTEYAGILARLRWETTIRLTMPTTGYRFLVDPDGWWLNGSGRHAAAPTDAEVFGWWRGSSPRGSRTRLLPGVDRFANGDPVTTC
jgi:hypothetical protein